MPLLTERRVRAAAKAATPLTKSANRVLAEAMVRADTAGPFDIFLSHSTKDAEIVLGTVEILTGEFDLSVYVDWIVDPELRRSDVSPHTADALRARMKQCKALVYLKTENSADSKWMPWELGYFDALRGRVAILPLVSEARDVYRGTEYLGLYPYVDVQEIAGSTDHGLWVNRSRNEYASFGAWLKNPAAIRKR